MSRKQDQIEKASTSFAAKMAAEWSDEHLATKQPADLARAYGCSLANAERVLKNELTQRRTRR